MGDPYLGFFKRKARASTWRMLNLLAAFFSGSSFLWSAEPVSQPEVFTGPSAEYEQIPLNLSSDSEAAGIVRWVWLEERMNVARQNAPVRVPVFFAAGECHDPGELMLVRWPSRETIAFQADDVRRGPDGGTARLHLWFTANLGAGEEQRFALVRRDKVTSNASTSIDAHLVSDRLLIRAADSSIMFYPGSAKRGALAALQLSDGPVLEFPEGVGAEINWSGVSPAETAAKSGEDREFRWGSGPVFAKVTAKRRDKNGAAITQVFRVFGNGSLNIVQTVGLPESTKGLTLATQDFLRGRVTAVDQLTVRPQSAGVVDSLLGVHPGYVVDSLIQGDRSHGWLVVPGTLGGVAGRAVIDSNRQFRLQGPGDLTPGSGDAGPGAVRTFWAEVTFVPARREGQGLERTVELAAGQPLVAIVERPGVSVALAVARIQDNVREFKSVGWVNESVVRSLQGKADPFPQRKWNAENDPAFWVADAQRAAAKVMGGTVRPLREDEKGRAAGSIDPYHITYESTALVHWLARGNLPVPVLESVRARMEAVRRQLGRTDEGGWPYLDVFFRTQNMQMGPPLLTLSDAGADPSLRQYYRDQLAAPVLGAVMLRGLRPYQGRPQLKPSESDTLYQAVVDFMLRATELTTNLSLNLHPVVFGRYLDAIDVNADLYHPVFSGTNDEGSSFARANFFRTQSHLHRWLAWGPAPFIGLLQAPPKQGSSFPGATEAWAFANALSGRWKNWPDQSWLFLASVLPEKAAAYSPLPRPAKVETVHVQRLSDGNHLSWKKRPDANTLRVYRLRHDLPPVWLNSPYTNKGVIEVKTEWVDRAGENEDDYLVHVVDKNGQESPW